MFCLKFNLLFKNIINLNGALIFYIDKTILFPGSLCSTTTKTFNLHSIFFSISTEFKQNIRLHWKFFTPRQFSSSSSVEVNWKKFKFIFSSLSFLSRLFSLAQSVVVVVKVPEQSSFAAQNGKVILLISLNTLSVGGCQINLVLYHIITKSEENEEGTAKQSKSARKNDGDNSKQGLLLLFSFSFSFSSFFLLLSALSDWKDVFLKTCLLLLLSCPSSNHITNFFRSSIAVHPWIHLWQRRQGQTRK